MLRLRKPQGFHLRYTLTTITKSFIFYLSIFLLLPLLILFCVTFAIYRKIIDIVLKNKLKNKYGGLVEISDAVFLVKDTTKFTITSVLIAKSDAERNMMDIVKSRIKNKIFDDPQRYPKLTSGLNEYGGYAYWIKNDYVIEDCLKTLEIKPDKIFNEENLKILVGEISGSRFPKNDKGLWEILVCEKPLENYDKDNRFYYYPIIARFSHAIADGTSLIALLIDIIGDSNAQNYNEKLFKKLFDTKTLSENQRFSFLMKTVKNIKLFLYIITIGFVKNFQLLKTRQSSSNALHAACHSGQKIAAWCVEDSMDLIPKIKNIKNLVPEMKFSYVIMAAVSIGVTNFFKRKCQPIPASTISLITVLLHFPELDSSKPARLANKTSVAIIDLPTAKVQKSKFLMESLREVKINMERTTYGDVMANYLLLAKIVGVLPLNISSKIVSCGIYTNFITNVPGGSSIEILDGCVLDNVIAFAPNTNQIGISFTFLSYDDRLHLGILVDKSIFASQHEAQQIANDIFEVIQLLDKEVKENCLI